MEVVLSPCASKDHFGEFALDECSRVHGKDRFHGKMKLLFVS